MKNVNKFNDPLREKPLTYIYLTFWYDTQVYKELRMVASHRILSESNEACKEKLQEDPNYGETIYNETVTKFFRPMVDLQNLCTTALRYICSSININNILLKYQGTGFQINAHINVMDDELSRVDFLTPEIFGNIMKIDPEFSLIPDSDLSMTLPSKLEFLNEKECKILDQLFNRIHLSKENTIEITYGQFWDNIEEDSDGKDTITKDEMDNILNNLMFYDLISIDLEHLEKVGVFRLSINDLTHFYDFLQQNDVRI